MTNKGKSEAEVKALVEPEVLDLRSKEVQLTELENSLSNNPEFKKFLDLQKAVNSKAKEVWSNVQEVMEANGVKNIKGDWGSITVAERAKIDTTDELPNKFYKKVVDTTKINDTFKLTGKLPKGATLGYTTYLVKRFK